KVAPCGLGARRAWNVGQRLQQPVHEHATRQGLVARAAAAGGGRAHGRRLVIGERGRDGPNRRRLGLRVAVEPGRAVLPGHRRGGGEGLASRRRRLAIAPHLAVAVVGALLERDRRLERLEHQVPPAALGPRALAVGPADDEAVDGARHGDVEQPPIFVLGLVPLAVARRAHPPAGCRAPSRRPTRSSSANGMWSAPAPTAAAGAAAVPPAASWYRRERRSALPGPWRRAPSSPAPRRG